MQVRGLDHGVSAGREDDGDALVMHEGADAFHGGAVYALNQIFGSTGFDRRLSHHRGRRASTFKGAGMRADDDRVARLERDQRFRNRGGGGIGGRKNGGNHADRNSDLHDLFLGDFAQNADGFHAAHAPRQIIGGQQVLDVLIFGVAVAGFFHGEFGQAAGMGARGCGHALHNGIHLFLGIRAVFLPGNEGLFDFGADLLNGQEILIFEHLPLLLAAAVGEDLFDLFVRPGDYVHAN